MERIAAGNLIIEQDSERWRLLVNGADGGDRLLLEAAYGEPVRYESAFGTRRGLSIDRETGGTIAPDRIERVVVGWSEKDAAWHLGLMLDQAYTDARGSRWCGLVTWSDTDHDSAETIAGVGQSLAQKLARPFALVPPKGASNGGGAYAIGARPLYPAMPPMSAPVDTSEVRHPIPQPALPVPLDDWQLQRLDAQRLELALSPAWARVRFWRAGWYIVLTGIFIVLTLTTLTSGIAYPRPEVLVYMGIASIFIMILGVLVTLWRAIRQPKRIVFDGAADRVVWLRGKSVAGEVPPGTLAAVYVSHVVSKVGRWADKDSRRIRHSELNLLLRDGSFAHVLTVPRSDETIPTTDDPLDEAEVVPLTAFNARTRLQSTALAIADTLAIPAQYDKRL
ncbi:MAG: hypothetical protein SGJ24_07385 [Chloroflexota bacterium]|nr:hypothetical protein [Chloroflexota bacterium]